jgi:hypothetical protein
MGRAYLFLVLFVGPTACLPLKANSIVFGTVSNHGAELAVQNDQFIAQEFDLTGSLDVSSVKFFLAGSSTDEFEVWITNSLGPGTALSNVIAL